MIFNESSKNRTIYCNYLQSAANDLNTYLLKTRKKKLNKHAILPAVITFLAIVTIGYSAFKIILSDILTVKGTAYIIPKESEIALIYTICLIIGIISTSLIFSFIKTGVPKTLALATKIRLKNYNGTTESFVDMHLYDPKYIILTYTSKKDKEKHQTEIQSIIKQHPHKKVIVYILPQRIPYIISIDDYVFCFTIKHPYKMQLLGIVKENRDHTIPAILAQTHKVGQPMKGETIDKNYEIVS